MEDFKIGSTVGGKYRIEEYLGQGGMGSVYRVTHLFLNKEFALKAVNSRVASEIAVQRFQQEAKTATRLSHPSLVQVHDFGMFEDGTPYLVMDYIDGITFAELLKQKGPISVEDVPVLFSQVCFGLLFAHECGIVHRDIKPGNIMLCTKVPRSAEGSVKIVDFGIAKLLFHEAGEIQALTRTGEIFGSPLYMSPEQCIGDLVDHRSDIYSLGCVLFEMLTGTPPYVGPTALNTMMLHDSAKPPTLKEASLGKEFPPALERVVAKMLARLPVDRYENIGEAALSLTKACAGDLSQSSSIKSAKSKQRKPSETISVSANQLAMLVVTTAVVSAVLGALGMKFMELKHSVDSNPVPNTTWSQHGAEGEQLGVTAPQASDQAPPKSASEPQKGAPKEGTTEPLSDSAGLLLVDPKTMYTELLKNMQNAVRTTSSISSTGSERKKVVVFPRFPIGTVELYSRVMPAPVLAKAEGSRSFEVGAPLTLDIGETAEAFVATPSIISKFEPDLFKGLFIRLSKSVSGDSNEKRENYLAATIGALSHWTNLEALGLHYFVLNNSALEKLNSLEKLRCLELSHCLFNVQKFAEQSFLRNIEDLNLTFSDNVDPILMKLSGAPNLRSLNIIGSDFSASGISALRKCKNLTTLNVSADKVNDEVLDAVKSIKNLRLIWLSGRSYKTEHVKKLLNFPSIKNIWLDEPKAPFVREDFKDKRVIYLPH